jgi:hypothetical protein
VGAGGAVTQPAATAATASNAAKRAGGRLTGRRRMEWIFLESLLALALAIGIVWWTLGPKARKRPPDDPGARR